MRLYKLPVIHEAVLLLSFLASNSVTFFILGIANRWFLNRRLTTLYCTYPVNAKYLKGITRPLYAPLFKWRPGIVSGFLVPGGGGITVVCTASETEMESANNHPKLERLEQRLKLWARLMGADQLTHGGRMPSILENAGIASCDQEAESVASLCVLAVAQISDKIADRVNADPNETARCPVAVIGSLGFVGQRAVEKLRARMHPVLAIDKLEFESNLTDQILDQYRGLPLVVLNLSRKGVLAEYSDKFWPGTVIVDDVYPEATQATRDSLRLCGAKYLHVSGVRAMAFPRLIGAYEGVMPFCAVALKRCTAVDLERIKGDVVLREG